MMRPSGAKTKTLLVGAVDAAPVLRGERQGRRSAASPGPSARGRAQSFGFGYPVAPRARLASGSVTAASGQKIEARDRPRPGLSGGRAVRAAISSKPGRHLSCWPMLGWTMRIGLRWPVHPGRGGGQQPQQDDRQRQRPRAPKSRLTSKPQGAAEQDDQHRDRP